MGQDKGSLTEQQTEGTVTTIQKRGIHRTNRTTPQSRPPRPQPRHPELRVSSRRAAHPTGTQHDGTWYGIPCSVWPGGVRPPGSAPSWSPVKINPVLAEPRTIIPACLDSLSNNLRSFYFTLENMDSLVGQPLRFSRSKHQTAISVVKPCHAV